MIPVAAVGTGSGLQAACTELCGSPSSEQAAKARSKRRKVDLNIAIVAYSFVTKEGRTPRAMTA
jgi:hypothetical protein